MKMCPHPGLAIIVCERTLEMITALNGGVTPEIKEDVVTDYFMIYCAGSSHEEREFISVETYDRTYAMPPAGALMFYVEVID